MSIIYFNLGTLRFGAVSIGVNYFGADHFVAKPYQCEKKMFSKAFKKPHALRSVPFHYIYIPIETCLQKVFVQWP